MLSVFPVELEIPSESSFRSLGNGGAESDPTGRAPSKPMRATVIETNPKSVSTSTSEILLSVRIHLPFVTR